MSAYIMPPALAFATKVEAYSGRGRGDPWSSRDLEDLILLLEGRAEIVKEILDSSSDVREAVRAWASELLVLGYTEDLIDAHLTPGPLQEERGERVLERLRRLAQ